MASFNVLPTLGFGEAVKLILSHPFQFSGRARRSEFWWGYLAMFLALLAAGMFGSIFVAMESLRFVGFAILAVVYVAFFGVSLAMISRRLHDTGRSAWWFLISFIPFIGGIVLFVFELTDSQPNENEWGESPKYAPAFNENDKEISDII